jgi:predicted Fe-Mo cluster-binding NifX family protein
MKIAAVTNNGSTISKHFGKSRRFVVVTVENGRTIASEERDKMPCTQHHPQPAEEAQTGSDAASYHDQQFYTVPDIVVDAGAQPEPAADPVEQDSHASAIAVLADCDVVLAGGMGQGMFEQLRAAGIRPILTDILRIDQAVQALLEDRITNKLYLLH